MRKQATIRMTKELLKNQLGIKDDISVVDLKVDQFRGTVTLLLESDKFDAVGESQYPPEANPEDVFE